MRRRGYGRRGRRRSYGRRRGSAGRRGARRRRIGIRL